MKNIAHAHFMMGMKDYKHILIIFNIYHLSMPTKVTRMHLNVMFIQVCCLSYFNVI